MLDNLKILYVEDEDIIRNQMVRTLEFLSAKVIAVGDGKTAYDVYLKEKPDIIIADIEMPGMSGLELSEKIRASDENVQIIIITAYTNTEYFLKAVELKLTKYLLKPVKLLDLENALNLCLEKLSTLYTYKKYFNENDYYDMRNEKLIANGQEVHLEFQEKIFLELLLDNAGQVVGYQKLEENVWPQGMSDAALRSLIFNLRQKLPENAIKNVSKTGYRLIIKE